MNARTVVVKIRAEVAAFKRDMDAVAKAAADVGTKTEKSSQQATTAMGRMFENAQQNEQAWRTASATLAAFGAAGVAAAGVAVAAFANFDEAMSSVQASTMESADNMELLREAAIDAGQRTKYSATEAAAGIEELAKAGVSTADILNGGLDGALDLAAAGNIAVADAAETAASAMTQFGLSGSDVTHIADLLAAGAGKAQGGVSDLSQALNQSGLVASQMGLSIEETVGSLTAFASAGLIGSDAGTSFRAMLLRLANPTGKSAQLMDELGLSVYNAQGEFIGMEALAGQLQDRLGTLTQEQRNAALATIFGQDAIRSASILYEEGADGIADWTTAVDEQGYAAKVAAIQMDNLKGDLEQLGGAFETWMIQLGEGGDGALRTIVQGVTEVVNKLGELPPAAQQVLLALTGGGGLLALGVAGFMRLVIAVNDVRAAMAAMNTSVGQLASKGAKIAAWSAVVVGGFMLVTAAGRKAQEAIYGAALSTDELDRAVRNANFEVPFEHLTGSYNSLGEALNTLTSGGLLDKVDRGMSAINQALGGQFPDDVQGARDAFAGMGEALAAMPADQAAEKFALLRDKAAEFGVSQEELLELMPEYHAALQASDQGQSDAAGSAGELSAAAQDLAAEQDQATQALEDWTQEVSDADAAFIDLLSGYQDVIDKNREVAQATADSTADSSDSWEDYYDGFTVGLEEYLDQLEQMQEDQENWESNMLILSGRVSQGVIDELSRLGPEGAPLVADLVNASDSELARLEDVYGNRSDEATGAFAENLRTAGPVLAEIMSTAGADAAQEAADALASGEMTMQEVIDKYDLDFVVDADTGAAETSIQQFFRRNDGKAIKVYIDQISRGGGGGAGVPQMQASGGPIFGPGTETSDSIPALLSNNEHVLSAREVRGLGGHDAVAQLRAMARSGSFSGFASGGAVAPTYQAARVNVAPVVQVTVPDAGRPALQVGQLVAADPNAAAHVLMREFEFKMMGN